MSSGGWYFSESNGGGFYIALDGVVLSKYGEVKDIHEPISSSSIDGNVVKVNFLWVNIALFYVTPVFRWCFVALKRLSQ